MSAKGRIVFFDNLKGILIFLVVLGHVIIPVYDENYALDYIYQFIYVFHMPLFIFISGFFAKSSYKNGVLKVERVISFFVLGILFQIILIILNDSEKPLSVLLLNFNAAPWYLISMSFWYASLPFFSKIKPCVALTGSLIAALAAGCFDELGDFLALSRTIVFLPFFLLGYYCNKKVILKVKQSPFTFFAIAGTLIFVVMLALFQDFFAKYSYISLARTPYKDADSIGIMARMLYIAAALVISLAIIKLTPQQKTFLAILGERTLSIYILHRVLRPIMIDVGLYDLIDFTDPFISTLFVIVISVLVTAVCSISSFKKPFDAIINCKWSILKPREG